MTAAAKNPESGGNLILAPGECQGRISERQNEEKTDRTDNRLIIRRRAGAIVMPRRAATVKRDIPLCLIAPIVKREVKTNGEELARMIVQKTRSHFSNGRVRTRLIHRELRGTRTLVRREDPAPTADGGEAV